MGDLLFGGVPFNNAMAAADGISRQRLRTLILRGKVRRLLPGAFVDAAVPDDIALRAAALLLLVPADAAVCGTTAAWLHGVPVLLPSGHVTPHVPEIVRAAGCSNLRRVGVQGRSAPLPDGDLVMVHGVLVTTPVRTGLDLARFLDRPDGLAYVDAMLRRELVSREELQEGLAALGGCRWVEQARELTELGDARAESPGESWLRLRWIDAGLPQLELQISLFAAGREVARLDGGIPLLRFGLEYDGEECHGPDREEHDAKRRRWLQEERGWDVLAVGRDAVLGRTYAFEAAVAECTGLTPELVPWELRRRTYLYRRRRRASGNSRDGTPGSTAGA